MDPNDLKDLLEAKIYLKQYITGKKDFKEEK